MSDRSAATLDELENLAKAVTVSGPLTKAGFTTEECTRFTSALSPDVILSLIAEVRQLRSEFHKTRSLSTEEKLRAQLEDLRSSVAAKEAALVSVTQILQDYSGSNKMSETRDTLLIRFERFRNAAQTYLEKYPK